MLDDRIIAEIRAELAHYEHKRAAAPEALKIAQRHRGYVSDETLADVAALLGMTPAELEDVATFYNLIFRRPVGRHVILVCDSISCHVCGCVALLAALRERLGVEPGQTTADGRFTLLPTACLGACDRAPAMMVDEDLQAPVAPESVAEVLARYV
jgi:NADH-quinone oxidoreductase subunit E